MAAQVARTGGFAEPRTPSEVDAIIDLAQRARGLLATFEPSIFEADLESLLAAMQPAEGGAVRQILASLFDGRYRAAKRAAGEHLRDPGTSSREVLQGLDAAQALVNGWLSATGDRRPALIDSSDEAENTFQEVAKEFDGLPAFGGVKDWRAVPLDELGDTISALSAERATLMKLPRLAELGAELQDRGLDGIAAEACTRGLSSSTGIETLRTHG